MSTLAAVRARARPVDVGVVSLAGAAVLAAIVGVLATRHGLNYRSDSAIYLGTAHNLLHGRGLTSPITLTYADYFTPRATVAFNGALPVTTLPPLYSIGLATIGAFGVSLTTAARVLGVVCLAGATFLVGFIALRLTGAWIVALAVAALFLGGGALSQGTLGLPGSWIMLSASALSEVLFLVLALATLLMLARLLERPSTAALWGTAVLLGLAILCRYLGVALLVTAALLVIVRRGWDLATRVRRVAVLAVVGAAPVVVWMGLLRVLVGHGKPLPTKYHPFTGTDLGDGVKNVAHWFVPTSTPTALAVAVLVAVLGVAAAMAWAVTRPNPEAPSQDEPFAREAGRLALALAVFAVVYLLAVFGSHLFLARNISFDVRFLAVVRPIVYVLLVAVAYRFLQRFGTRIATTAVVAGCAVVVVAFVGPVEALVRDGAAPAPLRVSATLAAVKRLPKHALIFSNGVDAIWGTDGREAVLYPVRWVNESDSFNPRLGADVQEVAQLLRRPDSYVVMFHEPFPGTFAPIEQLQRVAPLEAVGTYADGTIYRRSA